MSIAFLVTIFLLMSYAVAFTAIVHCQLHSKYPQAALAWCGVIIMLPFLGAFFFFFLGINTILNQRQKTLNQPVVAPGPHPDTKK